MLYQVQSFKKKLGKNGELKLCKKAWSAQNASI